MHLGVIADDFTGASDVANTLTKGGLYTVQFLGLPAEGTRTDCDAGVVALKTRSIAAQDAVRQSLQALDWLKQQGCRQFLFKYCSTFDSTPEGNIGPVGEALANALGALGVPSCPAFPTTGRTVYQGHLFVGDRLLSESGMENHPLNPMTDPDLRRWLKRQAKQPVGFVSASTVNQGADAIRKALMEAAARKECMVIVDAVADEDLLSIGEAAADLPFLTGGSGIALGLPGNFIKRKLVKPGGARFPRVAGPGVILAGSCSKATLGQIEIHRAQHPSLAVDVDAVMRDAVPSSALVAFALQNRDRAPLIYSSANPEQVRAAQSRYGAHQVSGKLEQLFAQTARALVDAGVRRVVVAGGETSGAVVGALGIDALAIGPEIDPGVPALATTHGERIGLALKSGNFGAPEFFQKALRTLESGRD